MFCFRNVKELLFRAGILRQKRKRTAGQAVLKKSALYKERTGVSAVPIFLMISGMLLLGKDESIGFIWKKRIPKYVAILLVFSLIFYTLNSIHYNREFSIMELLICVYSKGVLIPYWFLYAYITFLILLPFIRKMARNFTGKEFINELGGIPADYDYRTIYDDLFGGKGGYICGKETVMEDIKKFVEER